MDLSGLFPEDTSPELNPVDYRSSSLSDLFSEEPVPLPVFIRDKKYLNYPQPSAIQYDLIQHAERIYLPDLYPRMAEEFHPYWAQPVRMVNFLNVEWGKGGGKDFSVRICQLRVVYLLQCLKSPQRYFGMPEEDWIHLLNIAINAEQAEGPFFRPMVQTVKRGWFADKADPTQRSIKFDKNIETISGNSETEGQEGKNLIMGVADEIDGFKTRDQVMDYKKGAREPTNTAEGILRMMRTSGASRFPKTHKQIRISFPRYVGSPIQKLVKQSREHVETKKEKSNHYFSGPWATWEVKPNVTREDFQADYDEDPIMAAAMYECMPSYSLAPFITNLIALEESFVKTDVPSIQAFYVPKGNSYSVYFEFAESFVPMAGAVYAIHADLAVTGDRAGIAMSHVWSYEEHEEKTTDKAGMVFSKREYLPRVKTDFAFALEADLTANPPREIQIRWVRELCFELQRRGFNIGSVTYDGYQSTDSIQLLTQAGIESGRVSVDLKPDIYLNLRDLLNSGRSLIPFSELLKKEMEGLTRKPNGKIDHPPVGSKDVADAVAASVHGAILLGGQETGERAYYNGSEFTTGDAIMMPSAFQHLSLSDVMNHPDPFTDYSTFPMSIGEF